MLLAEDAENFPQRAAMAHLNASAFMRLLTSVLKSPANTALSRPLPDMLLQCFCESCQALLLPGVSCNVRVVHQSHQSALNRKRTHLKAKHKHRTKASPFAAGVRDESLLRVRNMVVVSCQRCSHVHRLPGATVPPSKPPTAARPPQKRPHDRGLSGPLPPLEPTKRDVSLVKPIVGSIFGPPPSPPRKFLDGPKKKKKKVAAGPTSGLNAFLKSLRPSTT
jgi:RNase P subunit RPR2